jgi:methylated-DNA-protein-cysteine methyltransferase related protein
VTAFDDAIADVVLAIPSGTVVSYGWVAAEAGKPGAARAVGRFLGRHPEPLPWWRVVRGDGRLADVVASPQADLLRAEGVEVVDGRVRSSLL